MEKRLDFLISKAKLDMSEEEKRKYLNDWKKFQEDLKLLDSFDTSNIEPLLQPFEIVSNELRDDSIDFNNNNNLLENASLTKDGFVLLKNKKEVE